MRRWERSSFTGADADFDVTLGGRFRPVEMLLGTSQPHPVDDSGMPPSELRLGNVLSGYLK